ncbi:uncharacterized protein [Clytia hemisphaerica]|uniref:Uncharacterized protein n=1 Tax=Clytia hemisphaerica TaxID=252671 RepID=A0A7M5X9T2_9CNID
MSVENQKMTMNCGFLLIFGVLLVFGSAINGEDKVICLQKCQKERFHCGMFGRKDCSQIYKCYQMCQNHITSEAKVIDTLQEDPDCYKCLLAKYRCVIEGKLDCDVDLVCYCH